MPIPVWNWPTGCVSTRSFVRITPIGIRRDGPAPDSEPAGRARVPRGPGDQCRYRSGIGQPDAFRRGVLFVSRRSESEEAAQRQILSLLAARGYRVVPVTNADTGLELANRMRFDAAFCSDHAPGLNWVELSERMLHRVGAFVLLSDGYRADLAADFEGDGCYVLAKPVQEAELDRLLRDLEPTVPIARNGAA